MQKGVLTSSFSKKKQNTLKLELKQIYSQI